MTDTTKTSITLTEEQKHAWLAVLEGLSTVEAKQAAAPEEHRPVSDWENREVKGAASKCKTLHEAEKAKVAELRARQEAYYESLPTDAKQAVRAISKALPDVTDLFGKPFAVKACLIIVNEFACHNKMAEDEDFNHAMFWLANQALQGMHEIEAGLERARDIARHFSPLHEPYRA